MLKKHGPITLPTQHGTFVVIGYKLEHVTHLALTLNLNPPPEETLVRIQSSCRFGETFQSLDCDCGPQLWQSMELISKEGAGIIIYLDQEGRGAGIERKLDAIQTQQFNNLDTVEAFQRLGLTADMRDYSLAIKILQEFKIHKARLLTNTPRKIEALNTAGIITKREPLIIKPTEHSEEYLKTKRDKLGHYLPFQKAEREP